MRDYIHYFQAKVGFSEEVEQQLVSHPYVRDAEEWKRHEILLLDEMYIWEDVEHNKHTQPRRDHLKQFEWSLQDVGSGTLACQLSQRPCLSSWSEGFLQSSDSHLPTSDVQTSWVRRSIRCSGKLCTKYRGVSW